MHGLGVVPRAAPMSTRLKTFRARQITPALGTLPDKFVGLGAQNRGVGMAGVEEWHGVPDGAGLGGLRVDLSPHVDVQVCLCVADEVHYVLGAAQQDIDAVFRPEKPYLPVPVASHERHDFHLCLLALEVVHRGQAQRLKQLPFFNRPVVLLNLGRVPPSVAIMLE